MARIVQSDNAAHIGIHCFERAGLGKAPFAITGYGKLENPACPEVPGGSCDYCGTGIIYACFIRSRDGRNFKVGCDCVAKTGDSGLIRAYKNLPEVRAANRTKAIARDQRVIAEWNAIMADDAARTILWAHQIPAYRGGMEPWGTFATRAWGYCGASGRARYLKAAKQLLSILPAQKAAE